MGAAEQILNGTSNVSAIRYSQQCLLCENIRGLPEGMHFCNTPWVCDECKEAIAHLKATLKRDPCAPILDCIINQPSSETPSQRLPKVDIMPL